MVVYITDSTAGVIKFSTGETLLFIADKLSNLIILDRYLHKSCIIIFYAYKTGVFWRDKLYPVYHTIICIDYDLILMVLTANGCQLVIFRDTGILLVFFFNMGFGNLPLLIIWLLGMEYWNGLAYITF